MKTLSSILLFMFLLSVNYEMRAQIPIFPIPSYNVHLIGISEFNELSHSSGSKINEKKKKEGNVKGHPCGLDTLDCSFTAYFYSIDGQSRLGPYTVQCGETLTVPLDDREWGVIVISDMVICVDVWISESLELKTNCDNTED